MTDTLQQLPCALVVTDPVGMVLYVNTDALRVIGKTNADWRGQRVDGLLTVASRIFLQTHVWPMLLQNGQVREVYVHLTGTTGQAVPVMVNVSNGQQGQVDCLYWVFFVARERSRFEAELVQARAQAQQMALDLARANAELSEIHARLAQRTEVVEEENRELTQLSQTDPLTGLGNRRALELAVQRWQKEGAGAATTSLLLIDIDHFKAVNDRFGHDEGDRALVAISRQLLASARLTDTVVRYGGEEFAIWLPGADRAGAEATAQRVHDHTQQVLVHGQNLTVSIGVATDAQSTPSERLAGLIYQADLAVYAAKGAGRNRTVHFGDLPATPA